MHIKSFDYFQNRELGKPCLIAGTAPTAEDFPYEKFGGIYITMGDGPIRFKNLFKPNYWINANGDFPIPIPELDLDIINSFPETFFIFADSAAFSGRKFNLELLEKNLKVNWFSYDQRHFDQKPCPKGEGDGSCCKLLEIFPGRLTIQEYIQKKYKTNKHYSRGNTVAIHALAFAILMGCSPIYLQGIELSSLAKDYIYRKNIEADLIAQKVLRRIKSFYFFYNLRSSFRKNGFNLLKWMQHFAKKLFFMAYSFRGKEKSYISIDLGHILEDFRYLLGILSNKQVEIFNLSKTSNLNQLSGLPYLNPNRII